MNLLGLPLMMLTLLAGGIVLFGLLYAQRSQRPMLRRRLLGFGGIWAMLYAAFLVVVSLGSTEHVLPLGERKTFCGAYLDCHLGVRVADVERTKTLGPLQTENEFLIVTVLVDSDAQHALLPFRNPSALLVDTLGNTYERHLEAEHHASLARGSERLQNLHLQAGASYEVALVFEVPSSSSSSRLFMTQGTLLDQLVESFLIGDEDSFLHAPTYLALS